VERERLHGEMGGLLKNGSGNKVGKESWSSPGDNLNVCMWYLRHQGDALGQQKDQNGPTD
jgi:hypothetical protein